MNTQLRAAGIAFTLLASAVSSAAELKPETVSAWDQYVQSAKTRLQERVQSGSPFLWIDETPGRSNRVRAGEILVTAAGKHNPRPVASGLIHDWTAAAFLPNTTLDETFAVLRDYGRYKKFYGPQVLDSKLVSQTGPDDSFSVVMLNKALLAKAALRIDFASNYVKLDENHWYSTSYSTRIREVENYGQAGEHALAPGEGTGYIWRLFSFAKFEARDGGVYIEVEVIGLSRDIPASLRWLVDPIVRRVSKNSLLISLLQTQEAVLGGSAPEVISERKSEQTQRMHTGFSPMIKSLRN